MSDHMARAQLALLHARRLAVEADGCRDPVRLSALRREMDVVYQSIVGIREEQLLAGLDGAKPTRRRWRRWLGKRLR